MEFDPSIISDPYCFQQNRLPAHSDHIIYRTDYEYLTGKSSYRRSLNGVWKFHYAESENLEIKGFEAAAYDCSNWEDIYVPAHIQMEGYGVPHYTNQTYPWEAEEDLAPGKVPSLFNPTAEYVKYFTLPECMAGQKIMISFQGVESGFALWLNGTYIGYSEDTFDVSEFDLTEALVPGENKLAVRVWKWTKSSWFEDQDFFRFSGIFRDVYLYSVPKTHLWDLELKAEPDTEYKNGTVTVKLLTEGKGKAVLTVYEGGLQQIAPALPVTVIAAKIEMPLGHEKEKDLPLEDDCVGLIPDPSIWEKTTGSVQISGIQLWSAEQPVLYPVCLEIYDENNIRTEIIRQYIGFRQFEMKDGLMCLNGRRIEFKGVNRHEFTCFGGRVPDFESLKTDLITMKQNNINALRTCHYPDDSHLYRLCDILGIYLIAESNMETHGTWNVVEAGSRPKDFILPGNHEEWRPLLCDRIVSCFQENRNHPSILIWSIGNESNGGIVCRDMAVLFRRLDRGRLVHYEGIFHDRTYPETSDMESQMYSTVTYLEQFLKDYPEKPVISCEYTHAMGNSCGGMHKYTDLADREPRYQGGFIWDYVDQAILKKDRYGNEFLGYGGDFTDRPSDTTFSGNGIAYVGERKASPKMQEVKYNYRNIRIQFAEDADPTGRIAFTVRNRNLFVNTDTYQAKLLLQADGICAAEQAFTCSVPPLDQAEFTVPQSLTDYMALAYQDAAEKGRPEDLPEFAITVSFTLKEDTIWARAGHEVSYEQKVFKKPAAEYTCDRSLRVVRTPAVLGVHGLNFSVMFGMAADGMISYKYAGREMLPNTIPKPNFWRAPVSNDEGRCMQLRSGQWKLASMYVTSRRESLFDAPRSEVTIADNKVSITYHLTLPTRPVGTCDVTYEVFGDATVQVTMEMDPAAELGDMPEFGMLFKLDADYDHLKWYGLGPEETYADRQKGGKLGIYSNLVKDNMAKYLRPQECGNKCGVRWAEVTDRKGRGMRFFGDEMSFSALPYTPHEIENAAHDYELPQIHYTVVRAAQQQMGIGGDDSWGSPVHEEYLIDQTKHKKFTFCFRGI